MTDGFGEEEDDACGEWQLVVGIWILVCLLIVLLIVIVLTYYT